MGGGVFEDICSFENLLRAWEDFRKGKNQKVDVTEFACDLIHNLLSLQADLLNGTYRHGGYHYFRIIDPRPREIHKASVRDRVVHHLIYRALYPLFDRQFISDSYSCRKEKGTHRALRRFTSMVRVEGRNNTRTVWALSCDIKKCFASIDHRILLEALARVVKCPCMMATLSTIVDSFPQGIPLGNLTSQLFVNVYLHMLDTHTKETLRVRRYLRYADDFVMLSPDEGLLQELLPRIGCFLQERLCLHLHLDKISLRTVASGVDFLGWVHFPEHRVLRTTTRRRMLKRLRSDASTAVLASYRGLLRHGNAFKLLSTLQSLEGGI